jgi:hypothetical protein
VRLSAILERFPSDLSHVFVMAGLVPAIHAFLGCSDDVDAGDVRASTPVFDGPCRA